MNQQPTSSQTAHPLEVPRTTEGMGEIPASQCLQAGSVHEIRRSQGTQGPIPGSVSQGPSWRSDSASLVAASGNCEERHPSSASVEAASDFGFVHEPDGSALSMISEDPFHNRSGTKRKRDWLEDDVFDEYLGPAGEVIKHPSAISIEDRYSSLKRDSSFATSRMTSGVGLITISKCTMDANIAHSCISQILML